MNELSKENRMYDFEDVNRILAELAEENVVEPIDEQDCHPLDWASVVGVDIWEELYPYADELADEDDESWALM
jgi:hypothetical protein